MAGIRAAREKRQALARQGSSCRLRCAESVFSSTFHQPREWFSIKESGLAEETKTQDESGRGRGNGDAERARRGQVVNYGRRL